MGECWIIYLTDFRFISPSCNNDIEAISHSVTVDKCVFISTTVSWYKNREKDIYQRPLFGFEIAIYRQLVECSATFAFLIRNYSNLYDVLYLFKKKSNLYDALYLTKMR